MITMRIKGGLGNQLFQYSAAYALSKRLNQPFQFNPSFTSTMTPRGYKLPELSVEEDKVIKDDDLPQKVNLCKNPYINKALRILRLSKHKCGDYLYWLEVTDTWQPDFFSINEKNIYVDGYFQSEDYFKQYRNDLIKQFIPKYEEEEPYKKALNTIKACNSIAVHVRRSDFKKDNNPFHYLLKEDYYKTAVKYIRDRVSDPVFFWFSDDIEWVKENIGESKDFIFMNVRTSHPDIDDMMLMKNCNHIITANSTFSWWAAWLNEDREALRIVPKRQYGMDGMIPKEWIKIL